MTDRSNSNSLKLFYTILFLLSALAVCTVDATAACGIPSCRTCPAGGTTCTECDAFSGLTPGGASCESCRNQPFCSNCTVSTACTRCNNTKYAPDSAGVCKPCPANCDRCSVSGPTGCDQCSSGYSLSGSTCIQCTDVNCAVCNATGCQACKSGYSVIGGICTKCANNCTSCTTQGAGKCDNGRCSAGFGIVTGQLCQACTGLRCRQCDIQGVTSGKCDSCIAPNVLQADNTCQFACSIQGCSDCTANPNFCTTCNAPLGVTPGGQCGPCGTGCAKCNKTSLCLTCTMVDSEGPLMNGSSACAPCASDCFSCSVNGAGKCDTCDPGFRLTATKTCEACTVTGCAKCPDATGTCTECLAGKVLSANTCVNCDPHCDFCNVNGAGNCDPDYCQAGYTFDSLTKKCIGAPTTMPPTTPPATTPPVCGSIAHCLDCHVDPNVCIMCDEPLGYGITATGKCDLCSTRTGCFRCHNLTQCTECTNPGTTEPATDGSGTCPSKNNTTVAPSSPANVTGTARPPVTAGSTGSVPPVTGGQTGSVPPVTGGQTGSVPPVTGGQTGSVPPVTGGQTGSVPPVTGGQTGSVPPVTGGQTGSVPPVSGGQTGSVPGPATGQTVGVITTGQGTPGGVTTGPIGPATTSPAAGSSGASSSAPPASPPGPVSEPSTPGVVSTVAPPASTVAPPASTVAPPASTMAPVSTTTPGGSGSSSNNNLWFLFIPGGVIALCALLCCCWYCLRGAGGPGFIPMVGAVPVGGAVPVEGAVPVRTRIAPPIIRTRVVKAAPVAVRREPQFVAAPAYHRGGIIGGPFYGTGF